MTNEELQKAVELLTGRVRKLEACAAAAVELCPVDGRRSHAWVDDSYEGVVCASCNIDRDYCPAYLDAMK